MVGSLDNNGEGGTNGEGKPVGVDEAKLFNVEKFGVGKPNGGNAPNDDIGEKPNGSAQGRSIKYYYAYKKKQQRFSRKERNHTIKS